jgi:predicted enzyme related to lactoylglutathione lyase
VRLKSRLHATAQTFFFPRMKKNQVGSITWTDLTVPDAVAVSGFYEAVVGWKRVGLDMGGYEDFCMTPPGAKKPAGGICHARGMNQGLPAQWLVYITVADLRASLKACVAKGGKVVAPLRDMGGAKMAVISDPAGAVAALFQPAKEQPAKKAKAKRAKQAK